MIIKHHITFKLRPYGKDNSSFQIQLHATFNGERLIKSTGCQLNNQAYWDSKTQRVKPGYKGPGGETSPSINATLQNCHDQMELAFRFFEANETSPSKDILDEQYQHRMGVAVKKPTTKAAAEVKPKSLCFFEVYDFFMKECGEKNAWTRATVEKMEAMRIDLMTFKSDLDFSDLTESTLTDFVVYMRDSKVLKTPRKKKEDRDDNNPDDLIGLRNSTIAKKLGYLRWFMNWATDRGYNTNLAYKTFRPTLKRTQNKVVYLNTEELARIRALDLSGPYSHLDPVRDVFIFCCFSGLRHSDVSNLRRNDIKGDHIEITTVKTADSISVELNEITRSILKKYKDTSFKDGKALPCYTNQAMNRDLKQLCKLAGIDEHIRITTYKGTVRHDEDHPKWELIGTHTGRRTFIVNALSLGIPPNIVMKWTGHSDYKSMKPYIDIVDSIKAESMAKFNDLLL